MNQEFIDDYQLELENRIKNLLWTVSGDYTLNMKPDLQAFQRSRAIALYDGIKQGAFAKYFQKDEMGMYLVKKVFLNADEGALTAIAQLCIEEAIGERIRRERPGVESMGREAFEEILDRDFSHLAHNKVGQLKIRLLQEYLDGPRPVEKKMQEYLDEIHECGKAKDSMDIIRVVDRVYNQIIDPDFEQKYGSLEKVLAVTLEELAEFSWEDYLSEEMYEDALENYLKQLTDQMTSMEDLENQQADRKKRKKTIKVVTEESLEKMHSYV